MSLLSIFGVAQVGVAKSDRSKIDETTLSRARDSKFDVRGDVSLRSTVLDNGAEDRRGRESKGTGNNFHVSYTRELSNASFIRAPRARRTLLSRGTYIRNNNARHVIKNPKYFMIRDSLLSSGINYTSLSFAPVSSTSRGGGRACRKVFAQSSREN